MSRAFCAVVLMASLSLHAQEPEVLAQLPLEDLMNIEITSVSLKAERLLNAAASVFVITAEDIRRLGATSLPEVLRLAPNVHVAQVSASAYAISARGFNNSAANKLLVLIDGRSVYTPLFSGVFWDIQDLLLEDIERIEIITGPGGTLWGTNAVNGVINIITRSAKWTRGGLITAGAGSLETNAAARYGGALGAHGAYRLYAKYFDRHHTSTLDGTAKDDAWHKGQAGFRMDWEHSKDAWTILGNVYRGREGQPLPGTIMITGLNVPLGTITLSGMNLTGRWQRHFASGANVVVQAYYDRTRRNVPPWFDEELDIGDVQLQYALPPTARHALIAGAEHRHARDRVENGRYFAFLPAKVDQRWTSVFAQDEVTLSDDVRLILGARLERNDYTGNEFLPSARLAWKFAPSHLLWTAASRTVRAPSRLDHDAFVPGRPPFLLAGGERVRSEIANVYEAGYRGQPTASISCSITAFHTVYEHLRTQEIAPTRDHLFFGNGMEGTTNGLEIWAAYQATRRVRWSAGFTTLNEELQLAPGSNDTAAPAAQEGRDPARGWKLRASVDLTPSSELDVTMRHYSELSRPHVPAYTSVNARLGWRPRRGLELSVIGQNLLDPGHGEFNPAATRTEIERSFFVNVLWKMP